MRAYFEENIVQHFTLTLKPGAAWHAGPIDELKGLSISNTTQYTVDLEITSRVVLPPDPPAPEKETAWETIVRAAVESGSLNPTLLEKIARSYIDE